LTAAAATLGVIVGLGWFLRALGERARIPGVVVLMALGIVGRSLGVIPESYLSIAPLLSAAAFAILLVRAGAALDPSALRPSSRFAPLSWGLGLLPALLEWGLLLVLAQRLLGLEGAESALVAFLISAVSPALLLPSLLAQIGERGTRDRPLLLGLGAQVIANALVAQAGILLMLERLGAEVTAPSPIYFLASWPLAILAGLLVPRKLLRGLGSLLGLGLALAGVGLYFVFRQLGLESVVAVVAFVAATRSGWSAGAHGVSRASPAERELRQLWRAAEIPLFVNLGSAVDLGSLADQDLGRIALIGGVVLAAVIFRSGVARIVAGLQRRDAYARRQVVVAQVPRATVQAVFGLLAHRSLLAVPGQTETAEIVLLTAFLAILLTAPGGALLLLWAGREGRPEAGESGAADAAGVDEL
jgi:solute carrier family 9B (sodium/hydrogen exchanger), member 1/2